MIFQQFKGFYIEEDRDLKLTCSQGRARSNGKEGDISNNEKEEFSSKEKAVGRLHVPELDSLGFKSCLCSW